VPPLFRFRVYLYTGNYIISYVEGWGMVNELTEVSPINGGRHDLLITCTSGVKAAGFFDLP